MVLFNLQVHAKFSLCSNVSKNIVELSLPRDNRGKSGYKVNITFCWPVTLVSGCTADVIECHYLCRNTANDTS